MSKPTKKSGFGSFLRMIFHRSHSSASTSKTRTKGNGKKRESSPVDFGIEETERLRHFEKPRPPANRRRPKSTHPSVRNKNKEEPTPPATIAPPNFSGSQEVLMRDGFEQYDATDAAKRMSKSVPNLNDGTIPGGSGDVVKSSSLEGRRDIAGPREGGKVTSRAFWHLLRRGSKNKTVCDSQQRREDDKEEGVEDADEDEVEIRPRERSMIGTRTKRSKSFGLDFGGRTAASYKELIAAAHKSSPPISVMTN